MTRSNKTLTNFILQCSKNPITFVGYSIQYMDYNKQINNQILTHCPKCCCMICCMP